MFTTEGRRSAYNYVERNACSMNRQERRAPRAIEKNLSVEDPVMAELLCPSERRRPWRHRSAGALAVLLMLLGLILGDALLMPTAGRLAVGAALASAV
jgi:hypothetical protein